ncbi:MAG: Peptidyl-tRNA hydrolase [Owenweeksia sp. TMED14]|nr:MAG: Peptidyl-tRNA hydrolase [Owenweeksia sp. TMED14]|tara:strand:- start:4184 stop:4747 length:564 start_codon:yes stop_codon:yes gene_type:complete
MKKYLIIGLGNPGTEYAQTRHNIGFKVLDSWINDYESSFTPVRYGDFAKIKIKGRTVLFIKPNTFMNMSGKAVRYWIQQESIPFENVVVVLDELALPLGEIRLKLKGSDGGHNGLKSIQEILGQQDFARLRFGIGQEFSKGQQTDFVLGKWTSDEAKQIEPGIKNAINLLETFVLSGPNIAMNRYNQ